MWLQMRLYLLLGLLLAIIYVWVLVVGSEELRAVLGHEISHIKHRDMMIMTILSIFPLITYFMALGLMWASFGGRGRGGIPSHSSP